MADEGVKWGVAVMGTALELIASLAVASDSFPQRLDQPALADARFAADPNDLARAVPNPSPPTFQLSRFLHSANKRRQIDGRGRLETALHPSFADHPPGRYRFGDAFQVFRPQGIEFEKPGDQT